MTAGFAHPEYLVDTEWLGAHLNDPQVRVLDCTTHLPPLPDFSLYTVVPGREDFEKAHIPGALFVDIDHDVSTRIRACTSCCPPPRRSPPRCRAWESATTRRW